jgi:hypothetical protein
MIGIFISGAVRVKIGIAIAEGQASAHSSIRCDTAVRRIDVGDLSALG